MPVYARWQSKPGQREHVKAALIALLYTKHTDGLDSCNLKLESSHLYLHSRQESSESALFDTFTDSCLLNPGDGGSWGGGGWDSNDDEGGERSFCIRNLWMWQAICICGLLQASSSHTATSLSTVQLGRSTKSRCL